jgi:hypothetical protein
MKANYLLFVVLLISGFSYSQELEKSIKEPKQLTYKQSTATSVTNTHSNVRSSSNGTVTISKKAGHEQQTHDLSYYNREIQRVEMHIAAIDTKVANVNSDNGKKSEADASGWFKQMENIRKELELERSELIEKRKNLK